MQSYVTLVNQFLILFYSICSFPCYNWLIGYSSSKDLGDGMMIPLEEYKHNNHIDIHNIKLVSQRTSVSLLGSYVLMFFCVWY